MPLVTVGPYVTGLELRTALKLGAAADVVERADAVAELANAIVFHFVGTASAEEWLQPPVFPAKYPAAATESALTIATDLWRRPSAPAGYVQIVDYVGRLAKDPADPVAAQLSILRVEWPIA